MASSVCTFPSVPGCISEMNAIVGSSLGGQASGVCTRIGIWLSTIKTADGSVTSRLAKIVGTG